MVSQKIEIKGLEIHFLKAGEGAPFFLLHGWGGSAVSLKKLGSFLAKKKFQVYLLDLPGFGASAAPKQIWGTADFADLVIEFSKKLKLDDFFLFGHSFGGRIAVNLAARYPQNISALILCAPSGTRKKKPFKCHFFWLMAKLGRLFFCLPPFCVLKETARKILYTLAREKDYYRAKGMMKKVFKKINKEEIASLLSKIKTRTLLIWGREDKMAPVNDARLFQQKVKNLQLKIIPGTHSLPKKQPRKVSDLIIDFLVND